MLEKYKAPIIFFCIIAVIMILFPPYMRDSSRHIDKGYGFIFNNHEYPSIINNNFFTILFQGCQSK